MDRSSIIRPNTFLIGAPRSGTTSMVEYLREHPNVFFSIPKEPHYWADDLPGMRAAVDVTSEASYYRLFRGSDESHQIIGEASTLYLNSNCAVAAALKCNPDAKFLVMLRRPIDLIFSFFNQQQRTLNEDQPTLREAWQLQEERAAGRLIPDSCMEPGLLQYRRIAMLGAQLQRAASIVPSDQLHILFFDQFCENTQQAYQAVLRFLALPDCGRIEFPHHNRPVAYRSRAVARMMETKWARKLLKGAKRQLSGKMLSVVREAKDRLLFGDTMVASESPEEFRRELQNEFADDIRLLADLTKTNLDHWL